ncbi:MAG: cooS, partial [Desulfacinum sp.]|nr:cooS [Desulfacinum sp.]
MAEEKKKKEYNFREFSTCEATIQMLQKAAADGVETAFQRAAE